MPGVVTLAWPPLPPGRAMRQLRHLLKDLKALLGLEGGALWLEETQTPRAGLGLEADGPCGGTGSTS